MTIKEIAEIASAGETTIRRWAEIASGKMAGLRAKMAGAQESKKPADFTLEETIAIIRAGGNETLADLLAQNAKEKTTPKKKQVSGLPNGKQIEQLRLMMQAGGNQERLAMHLAGMEIRQIGAGVQAILPGHPGATTPLGHPVSPEAEAMAATLMAGITSRDSRQIHAITKKAIENAASREAIDRLNGKLQFGGQP